VILYEERGDHERKTARRAEHDQQQERHRAKCHADDHGQPCSDRGRQAASERVDYGEDSREGQEHQSSLERRVVEDVLQVEREEEQQRCKPEVLCEGDGVGPR